MCPLTHTHVLWNTPSSYHTAKSSAPVPPVFSPSFLFSFYILQTTPPGHLTSSHPPPRRTLHSTSALPNPPFLHSHFLLVWINQPNRNRNVVYSNFLFGIAAAAAAAYTHCLSFPCCCCCCCCFCPPACQSVGLSVIYAL